MKVIKEVSPPSGFKRMLWRLPIKAYHAHLGRLFGSRLMLLTHTGRISGRPRQTVIEVVERSDDGSYVAASGFGKGSDWYRNVRQNPRATIEVGGRVLPVVAEPVPEEQGAELMVKYASRHRRTATMLCKVMGYEVDGSDDDWRAVGRRIPFVRFTAREVPRPEHPDRP